MCPKEADVRLLSQSFVRGVLVQNQDIVLCQIIDLIRLPDRKSVPDNKNDLAGVDDAGGMNPRVVGDEFSGGNIGNFIKLHARELLSPTVTAVPAGTASIIA